jgi:D-lactate dehydrogenase (cytochrome)
MRDLVLGIEAVLPDGSVWNGLRRLRKDNTGYDLKNLFIGAEGTLGVVTAAVLKLFPRPAETATALVGIASVRDAVALFGRARETTADSLTAFELISRYAVVAGVAHVGIPDPLQSRHPWYVLMDIGAETVGTGQAMLGALLGTALEDRLIADGVVASSTSQAKALWRIRESTWAGQAGEGASIKHDVSVPVSAVADFIAQATSAAEAVVPGSRIFAFGHVGDGNIHFNLAQPKSMDGAAFLKRSYEVHDVVHAIVARYGGSISAEHGIGRLKRAELARFKNPLELRMMRAVKASLDPQGLMNPGVLIPDA